MKQTLKLFCLSALIGGVAVADPGDGRPPFDRRGEKTAVLNIAKAYLRPGERLCLAPEIERTIGARVEYLREVDLSMTAESVFERTDLGKTNYLYVNGRPAIDRRGNINLPYNPQTITVNLRALVAARDFCFTADKDARLSNLEMSYSLGHGPGPGPGPGPNPALQFEGAIGSVDASGVVYGWACRVTDREPLPVSLWVDGRMVARAVASKALGRQDYSVYGEPSRRCGSISGFAVSFQAEPYAGRRVLLSIRAEDRRDRREYEVTNREFSVPRVITSEGIFNVGPDYYYAFSRTAYCHVSTPDQLLAGRVGHLKEWGDIGAIPRGMTDFRGTCPLIPYPAGLFMARQHSDTMIFYSNGKNEYCHVQHPGMLENMKWALNLGSNPNMTNYQQLPRPDVMRMPTPMSCKVAGVFTIRGSEEVYESDGRQFYCRLTHPRFIGGRPVFDYEDAPEGLTPTGDCKPR